MIVLNKRIKKSDSRKIVKTRTTSGIIKEKKIRYIWWIVIRPNVSTHRLFLRMGSIPALVTKTNQ